MDFNLNIPIATCQNLSPSVINSRKQFLQKVVTASSCTVQVVERVQSSSIDSDTPEDFVPTVKFNVDEYNKWMQLCFNLAKIWDLALDDLRRQQICELYSHGYDRLAEEVYDDEKFLFLFCFSTVNNFFLSFFLDHSFG